VIRPETEELVSQLRATLSHGIRPKDAEKVLHSLQDELLVPRGLYLNGGLSHIAEFSMGPLSRRIARTSWREAGKESNKVRLV